MSSEAVKPILGIKYVSTAEKIGYGESARRCIAGLLNARVPVTWAPMVHGTAWGLWYEPSPLASQGDDELDPICNIAIPYDTVVLHTVPEYFPHWMAREPGKRFFCNTAWETDQLPAHWPRILNRLDGVFVPSSWNKEVFQRCGVTAPVYVTPHIVPPRFSFSAESAFQSKPDEFIFYCVNAWNDRKAMELTVSVFLKAFTSNEPVRLILKTSPKTLVRSRNALFRFWQDRFPRSTKRIVEDLRRSISHPAKVTVITQQLSAEEMSSLHQRGDCFFSCTRGEGWGIGAFDSAAWGKPVIITGYGGQRDYLPEDKGFLIKYHLCPVDEAKNGLSYTAAQQWANPNVDHAIKLLREVFENPHAARARAASIQERILKKFASVRITEQMLADMRRLPHRLNLL